MMTQGVMKGIQRSRLVRGQWSIWRFPKNGFTFGGPSNKDYQILGSISGVPHLGKLPFIV